MKILSPISGVLIQGEDQLRHALDACINSGASGSGAGARHTSDELDKLVSGNIPGGLLFVVGTALRDNSQDDGLVDKLFDKAKSLTNDGQTIKLADWDYDNPRPHLHKTAVSFARLIEGVFILSVSTVRASETNKNLAEHLGLPLVKAGDAVDSLISTPA